MEENGIDTEGQEYPSAQAFWEAELSGEGPSAWYSKALKYWDQQEPTYNGVLAGYGHLSRIDLIDSAAFLKRVFAQLFKERRHEGATTRSVDCGAGVGRVSEHVLLHAFDEVDLLEPSKPLLEEARQRLAVPKAGEPLGKATKFICTGLQDFEPEARRYDCIWLQWVILCITDDGVVNALTRCKDGLRDGGYIIVKENICSTGFVVDREDTSICRSHSYLLQLFARAGLAVVHTAEQSRWPKQVYSVRMYALQPC